MELGVSPVGLGLTRSSSGGSGISALLLEHKRVKEQIARRHAERRRAQQQAAGALFTRGAAAA